MIVHRTPFFMLMFGLLLVSSAAWPQSSLRDQYQAQQQPKDIQYPAGFEAALEDFKSTWNAIIDQGEHFLITMRSPRRTPDGRRMLYDKNITRIFGVFVVGEQVFEPVYTDIRPDSDQLFTWKGQTFDCPNACRDCYVRPEPLGLIGEDGFVSFQSRYLLYERDVRKGDWGLQTFEVNFDTRECFVQGREGNVGRCHVVGLKDYIAGSLGDASSRFDSKLGKIRRNRLMEACALP